MPSSGVQTCARSEEHTSELQSHDNLVCRLLLEKKTPLLLNPRGRARVASLLPVPGPTHDAAGRASLYPSTPPPWRTSRAFRRPILFFLKKRAPPEFPVLPLPVPLPG